MLLGTIQIAVQKQGPQKEVTVSRETMQGRLGSASLLLLTAPVSPQVHLLTFSSQGKYLCRVQGKMPMFSSMSLEFNCQMNEWNRYFYQEKINK